LNTCAVLPLSNFGQPRQVKPSVSASWIFVSHLHLPSSSLSRLLTCWIRHQQMTGASLLLHRRPSTHHLPCPFANCVVQQRRNTHHGALNRHIFARGRAYFGPASVTPKDRVICCAPSIIFARPRGYKHGAFYASTCSLLTHCSLLASRHLKAYQVA